MQLCNSARERTSRHFFDKLTLAESNAKGGGTKYKPLSEAILNAIRGMYASDSFDNC